MTSQPKPGEVLNGESEYARAVMFATRDKPSCSYLQRRMEIPYNRAVGLIERMEAEGLISRGNSAGERTIIVPYVERPLEPSGGQDGGGEPSLTTHEHPDDADRTHVPHMERWAYNQMPKTGETDLRLMRLDGTDLYAWFGKVRGSVFEDRQALTCPAKVTGWPSREDVARLVSPRDWELFDTVGAEHCEFIGVTTDKSLERADAILALFQGGGQ